MSRAFARLLLVLAGCGGRTEPAPTVIDARPSNDTPPVASASAAPRREPAPPASDAPIAGVEDAAFLGKLRDYGYASYGMGVADTGVVQRSVWVSHERPRPRWLSFVLIDLDRDGRAAVEVGRDGAIFVDAFRQRLLGEGRFSPSAEVLADLRARLGPLPWTSDEMNRAFTDLGFAGTAAVTPGTLRSLGVVRVTGGFTLENTAVDVTLFDYRAARAEGRVLVDGGRMLFVTLCSACPDALTWPGDTSGFASPEDTEEAAAITQDFADAARSWRASRERAPRSTPATN